MRFTKKTVENYFTALKNFCPEIEGYSIIDSGVKNMLTITVEIIAKQEFQLKMRIIKSQIFFRV